MKWEGRLDKIRVLIANYPVMVPDAIRQLVAEQDDMEVVGDCRGPMKILQETGKSKADVVVLAQKGTDEPGLCSQLLVVYPDVLIISVTSDMTSMFTQQLRSQRIHADILNIDNLIQTLRAFVKKPQEKQVPTIDSNGAEF
jgi:DNA-binding NarL/FixJ family response regulator